jgi:tetratricopeptide (TPR) repeat protein
MSSDRDIQTQKVDPTLRRGRLPIPISLRVSPQGYFNAFFVGSFAAALCFYLEHDVIAVALFCASWIAVPILAFRDQIIFDGRQLERTGLLPTLWGRLTSTRTKLRLSRIEQVETSAVRSVKRGGDIHYRYRTVVRGRGISLTLASGGEEYRLMLRELLERLPESLMDNRSVELREHLADPKETLMKAEFSRIPSADVLESSLRVPQTKREKPTTAFSDVEDKIDDLRSLANELRLSGYLFQAVEAFRRALVLRPRDGRLLFEFARCLHSLAAAERDPKLQRRAIAALRLSQKRAADDGDLLVKLGEWYFQIGDRQRAKTVFTNAVEKIGENFRVARGLAELALHEGKIAHVIHHFSTANRVAETAAQRRWSKAEAEYFSNLNSDSQYLELELGRVNLLETVDAVRKSSLRLAFLAFPVIIVSLLFDETFMADLGWCISGGSILIWSLSLALRRTLTQRLPYQQTVQE